MKKSMQSLEPAGRSWGPVEAARILGVGTSTVQRWVDAGVLPAVRTPGGHRRIREEDIVAFKERGRSHRVAVARPFGIMSVLLVDDDELILKYVEQTILARSGHMRIHKATNGFDAGVLLVKARPDIVFLDILMPGTDGIEVCRRIRATPDLEGVRVVGITGSDDPETWRRMVEAGADVVLHKPIAREQILDQLAIALKLMPATMAMAGV